MDCCFAKLTLICCVAIAAGTAPVDRTAAAAADDLRFQLESGNTVFVPAKLPADSREVDLVVHFHGAADIVVREFKAAGHAAVLLVVNYRGLSSAYETPLSDETLFDKLLDQTLSELVRRDRVPGTARWRRLCVSSFSAGFGAVRALLRVPRHFQRIDALYLADTVYAGYRHEDGRRVVDPKNMSGFRQFATAAVAGRKTMIITHSYLKPGSYAGTHETADDLLAFVGLNRRIVDAAGPNDMRIIACAERGNFHVFGCAGATGADHMAHLRNMRFGYKMLADVPWWHRFPVYVGDVGARECDAKLAVALHAAMVSGNCGADPAWGPYGQELSFLSSAGRFRATHAEGIRWITWMEAFGESMLYAAAFDRGADGSFRSRKDDPAMARLVRSAWNWESAGARQGNAFRWVGLHNTTNDEDFIRPRFTRARLEFPTPHYPDGREAVGDLPEVEYPLSARVYDAVCVKDINGRLAVELERLPERANRIDPTTGKRLASTEGLFRTRIDRNRARYFPSRKLGDEVFASIMFLGKDPAAPFWTEYARTMARELIAHGVDGLWCDNYSSFNNFGMPPIRNGFGDWSEHRFREYLASNFTPHALRELRVDDAGNFDIRGYLKQKAVAFGAGDASYYWDPAWRNPRWQDEPVWNAYKVFKQHVGQNALRAFYAAIKEEAQLHGRDDFLIAGNDMPVYGLGWARDEWLDMVSSEQTPGWFVTTGARGIMLPPLGKYAVVYRVALEHQKGPYATAWYYLKGPYEKYRNRPTLAKVLSAEAFANATFLKYGGNPALPGTPESVAWWNGFVRAEEARFGRREILADIGLYFSPNNQLAFVVPGSHALDHDRQPHSFGHWGFGTALIDAHLPYCVVTDWKLAAATLAGLKTFIIPSTECLDDTEVAVLEQWVRDGGRLLLTGPCGTRYSTGGRFARRKTPVVRRWFPDAARRVEGPSGDMGPARAAAAGSDPSVPLGHVPGALPSRVEDRSPQAAPTKPLSCSLGRGSIHWSLEPLGLDYYVHETERAQRLPEIVDFIGRSDLVEVDGLASTVGLFLWQSPDGRAVFADLVNYNIDLATDQIAPATDLTFRLRLPGGWQNASIETITPDEMAPATVKVLDGRITVRLGHLVHYASLRMSSRIRE
jgi:hypothetical protein